MKPAIAVIEPLDGRHIALDARPGIPAQPADHRRSHWLVHFRQFVGPVFTGQPGAQPACADYPGGT